MMGAEEDSGHPEYEDPSPPRLKTDLQPPVTAVTEGGSGEN